MDSAMSSIMVNGLVRLGEHIGILPFMKKQIKPKNSPVANHLLFCNFLVQHPKTILVF